MRTGLKSFHAWLILLTVSCGAAGYPVASAAEHLTRSFVARYSLSTHGAKIGETEWSVKPLSSGLYRYESRTEAAGIFSLVSDEEIIESSEWRFDDGILRPQNYSYTRTGGKKDRNVTVSFDWNTRRAVNTAKGQSWQMPVDDGTLDKLSYVLVLMDDLAKEQPRLQYQIADGGKVKTYELQIEGAERLETALGTFDTVKVRRLRTSEERETLLWCARGLNYLPVKIEHKERDGTLLMRIVHVDGLVD